MESLNDSGPPFSALHIRKSWEALDGDSATGAWVWNAWRIIEQPRQPGRSAVSLMDTLRGPAKSRFSQTGQGRKVVSKK